jgi:hypothetical protein
VIEVRTASLEELQSLLRQTPVMAQMHPLSLAFLDEEVQVFESVEALIAGLDCTEPQPEIPMVALSVDERFVHRLPSVRCDHNPFTSELNRILLPKIGWVQKWVLCQSQVADEIVRQADADCVVLLIVDGLGFADWQRFAPSNLRELAQPCFVDGVSVTDQGMSRIAGEPSIALRLASLGYERSFGFSYWERTENELTNLLFQGVTEGVRKVRSFDEVLGTVGKLPLDNSFVQIVREGLDQVCHRHRDLPDIGAIVRRICDEFDALAQKLRQRDIRATLFLTADHGILWQHEHELRLYEAGSGNVPPRYYEGLRSSEFLWRVNFKGNDFSVLAYPFIRRQLRSTEWGVHGGLSFEESFVPLVKLEVP